MQARHNRILSSGFTLIEMLVVIVIISIIATTAVLTIHVNKNKQIESLAQEIVRLLSFAETKAMLKPTAYRFVIEDHGFQFYEFGPAKNAKEYAWHPITHSILGYHPIPNDITVILNTEESTMHTKIPFIITPSRDITPFKIFIGKKNEKPSYQIKGDMNGNIISEPLHA